MTKVKVHILYVGRSILRRSEVFGGVHKDVFVGECLSDLCRLNGSQYCKGIGMQAAWSINQCIYKLYYDARSRNSKDMQQRKVKAY